MHRLNANYFLRPGYGPGTASPSLATVFDDVSPDTLVGGDRSSDTELDWYFSFNDVIAALNRAGGEQVQ